MLPNTASGQLYARACKVLVEGVSSASRGPVNYTPHPPYMRRAVGAYIYDADDNEYVDWMMSFGALPMGHAHPMIVNVVQREVANGTHFASALEVEVEVAEKLVSMLPTASKIRFANTGTEACMAAFRMARALTGRSKIVKFEGHYHGWYDAVLLNSNAHAPTALGHRNDPIRIPDSSGLTPGSLADTIVVPWNDEEALTRVMESYGRQIACVATEGIMTNMGVIPPRPGYLAFVQKICREYGALFYLDETVTGFRVGAEGCAGLYGLEPDIITYGKALGQGFPIAAITGPDQIMSALEWGKVLHYGTHNAPRLGLFATKTMLAAMTEDGGAGFDYLQETGRRMTEAAREVLAAQSKHRAIVQNVGSLFQIYFTDRDEVTDYRDFCEYVDRDKFRRFANLLLQFGVYICPSNALHNLSSLAHTTAEIEKTSMAFARALDALD
ncbi:aspartate aminotransferase family protein [Mesorhizobium sp. Root102]|uniref:aspartate aminotransferase family protein n=1 Tax=Mesorhizobium sp. Root102 TaxID=1736422 RepID=UPI0006FAE8B1|nr:aspartate aminotransferase family protein [Mesorhizobium sp. Root102]